MESDDPYEVLDVPRDVSAHEVRAAYRRLLRTCRPEDEPEQFQRIRAAYEVLREGGIDYEAPVEPVAPPRPEPPPSQDDSAASKLRFRASIPSRDLGPRLAALDAKHAHDEIPDALDDHFGGTVDESPEDVAASVLEAASVVALSSAAISAMQRWVAKLDGDVDWVVDAFDFGIVSASRDAETKSLPADSLYPSALFKLLNTAEYVIDRSLFVECAALFTRDEVEALPVRRANAQMQKHSPELWGSWEQLRRELVDAVHDRVGAGFEEEAEGRHDGGGDSAAARAWELLKRADKAVERQVSISLVVALVMLSYLAYALFVRSTITIGAAGLITMFVLLRWLTPWLMQRAFDRGFVPFVLDELRVEQLSMAEIYTVLLEREQDFGTCREYIADVHDHIPLWLWSAGLNAGRDADAQADER